VTPTDDHDIAHRAAVIASELDPQLLADLLALLRDENDSHEMRRIVEQRMAGTSASWLLELLQNCGDPRVALVALEAAERTAEAIRAERGETTVVWTGPTVQSLEVRPTRQVVRQLIAEAQHSLTIVTFAGRNIAELVQAVDQSRLTRGVEVRLILESEEDSGGRLKGDTAVAFGNLAKAVPVYYWPLANRGPTGAAMHVKAVIVDRRVILVSSANLTDAAMDRNMELGLLVRGGPLPQTVDRHFDELIETGQLVNATILGA
jgi:phosphatidylserine/phosphatidylglycerophosphate/cardiolipin synthase-like enzyme